MQLVGVAGPRAHLVEHLGDRLGRRAAASSSAGTGRPSGPSSPEARGAAAPPGSGAPRAGRRRGRCRAGRSGSRGRGATARPTRRSAPRLAPASTSASSSTRPSTSRPRCRQSCDRLAHQHVVGHRRSGRAAAFSWQAARPGQAAASRSSASMRWRWIGRRLPPVQRGTTRARLQFQRQRAAEHRVGQHGLGQHLGAPWRSSSIAGHLGEREAVLGAEREHHGVVVGRRLQLEVERDAEPLAQGQSEGPVDPPAEGGVDDQLGALALVEAALDDDALARRQVPERRPARRPGRPPPGRPPRPTRRPARDTRRRAAVAVAGGQQRLERGAQGAHLLGELGGARRAPRPARTGPSAGSVAGVVDPHRAHLDLGAPATSGCRGGRRRRCSPRPRSPRAPSPRSPRRDRARPGSRPVSGMAPPLVSAASRAPRRGRSRPLTPSWCRWAPRRPRPVVDAPARPASTTSSKSARSSPA